jgi:hypothetical protein
VPAPVPYADLANPQTLNLYAYVKNNPLVYIDPTGHLISRGSEENLWQQPQMHLTGYREHFAEEFALWELFTAANSEAAEQQQQPQLTTLTLGGVKVDVTLFAAEFSDGTKGAVIEAYPQGCGDCRWAQTTSRTGQDAHAARTDREAGSGAQPLYPGQPAPHNLVNGFADAPSSHKAGTFTAVTTLGVADRNSKTFKVLGSMTWGFKIDKNGKVTGASPRAATRAEQARSLAVLRHESPTWTIGP